MKFNREQRGREPVGGVGTSSNFQYPGSACKKNNWTQSDLRFCENEGSKRFKTNEKGGSIGSNIKGQLIQNA